MNVFFSALVLVYVCVHTVQTAIGSSAINCASGSSLNVGYTAENFEGDVEKLTGITPEDNLRLEAHLFPSGGLLYYSVTCGSTGFKNIRNLQVVDINDNAPVFEQKLYTSVVSETEAVGFQVLKVRAVDADVSSENSRVTYSIIPSAPTEFEVRNDGTIRLLSQLNYNIANVYNFTVKASDIGDLFDTTTVTINVQDFDNMNPYFDHALYQASIPENQISNLTEVTPEAIKAQDGDTGINEPVVYSITKVTPVEYKTYFNIDQNTGVISVTVSLDREKIENIMLQIQAAQVNDDTKTASAVVLVTVEDVDDNAPAFDQSEYAAVIPENSPRDYFIFLAKVTDLDQGGFMGTLRLVPDTVPFSIDSDGSVRVKTSAELDRETTPGFEFQIEAIENPPSTHSTTANVTIILSDENDNTPVFRSGKYEGKVSRDQTVGMLVVKVEATDLDEGPNGEIRYFIDFGNEEGYFNINENTGEIFINKTVPLLENQILQFFLYVIARDGGSVSRTSSVLVDIKAPGDSHPQFLQKTYQGKVEEEQEAGTEIVKVTFLSVSPSVPVMLTIETEADKFDIDHLGMLTTKVKLDHELQKNYTVLLSISDGTNRDEASVYIDILDINDNSPTFVSSSIAIDLQEDTAIGANVTQVEATDADSGLNAEIWYSLEGSAGMFSINPKTGLIVVAAALDRETQDKYNLIVVAQDQGRPPLLSTTSVVVTLTDVNDNAPIFTTQSYEASVLENATVGMSVIGVSATDKDDGPNGVVSYYIAKQQPPSPAAFSIDAVSGMISVAEKLDYSKAKKYILEVEGRDGGSPSLTGSAVVVVLVEDVNDKPPKFSKDQYDVAVYENIASGSALVSLEVTDEDKVVAVDQPVGGLSSTALINITVLDVNDNNPQYSEFQNPIYIPEDKTGKVTQIHVTDRDIGLNGEVSLTTPSYNDIFKFDMDGTLVVTGALDREKQETYDVVLVARDYGTPPRQNITTLTIIVTDVNDNAPVFSQPSYSTQVLANDAKKGDLVLTVSATDQDAGNNSVITYRFSEDSEMVELNPETGAITWTRNLSDITEDMHIELLVVAMDYGTPPLNSTATVKIIVRTMQATEVIFFQNSTYYFSVKENEPKETNVGEVKVLIGSQPIEVTYRLTSHTDLFAVDKTGVIKTLRSLDKEEKETYIVTVEATESKTPQNTAETTVVIQVEDVNESPVFEHKTYTAEIFSIAPFRYPVMTVKALDPDVWDKELYYTLQESSSQLGIDSTSGQINVKKSTSENIVVITLNQPVHTVEMKITEMQKSLEKVLGWNVHVISVRGEHRNEIGSRTVKVNANTDISFIAVDTDGVTISAKNVYEKLESESESLNIELEKVFGSDVELEALERENVEQENSSNTAAIVLGVMLALSLIALITLVVVGVIKFKKIKYADSNEERFNIGKPENLNMINKAEKHQKQRRPTETRTSPRHSNSYQSEITALRHLAEKN
ncbi:Protocadherin Fat 4 [Bagarius yarrelli]|uniref:Protocadherin Fat 4 n=1 Tax=Bagarius yarrelli TaxID=175774 RepID=A0A556TL17_BAGYA|nr:Protocadherin Fat 4 [Bagarius yarrelli]